MTNTNSQASSTLTAREWLEDAQVIGLAVTATRHGLTFRFNLDLPEPTAALMREINAEPGLARAVHAELHEMREVA